MNIILCGFMGSGKTVVGTELAKITGRKFVDTDEMVEKKQGVAIKAIFATRGEEYFRDLEWEVCKEVAQMKDAVISTGGGAMTFQRNVDAVKNSGKIVFLDADFDVICKRIGNKSKISCVCRYCYRRQYVCQKDSARHCTNVQTKLINIIFVEK